MDDDRSDESAFDAKSKIETFFNALTIETIGLCDDFYAEDCRFEDPLVEIDGRSALRGHYAHLYRHVHECRFEFGPIIQEGRTCCAPWEMHLRAKLGGGKLIVVPGISRITFDGSTSLVTFHRDYFDVGAFVYENVPVLGPMVRYVKRRMHPPGSESGSR